jgi:dTDP-4-amino-4,6-dideoxygalactose transaminase
MERSMGVPLLDFSAQHRAIREEVMAAVGRIVDSGGFILGRPVEQFESNLARYCGVEHAVANSSGTDALILALMALKIGPGDEVIVPSFTFFATAGCVHRVGATPVFVDIDPATYNISPPAIEAAIGPRTRAIIPVHLFGQCADMDGILQIARRSGLPVIEDAAQAIGARDHDRPAGSIGTIGALSFYPTKNLGAFGDAGACLTHDAPLDQTMRWLRVHGQTDAYHHQFVGGNFRIDAIQAAILDIKLRSLDAAADGRRAAAAGYDQLLHGLPVTLPFTAPHQHHVFNQYTIRSDRRDALCEHLKARSIGHRVYYPLPLHLQPCFEHLGYRPGQLPHSEAAAREVVSLPIFPDLTEAQQQEVATAVRSFYDG